MSKKFIDRYPDIISFATLIRYRDDIRKCKGCYFTDFEISSAIPSGVESDGSIKFYSDTSLRNWKNFEKGKAPKVTADDLSLALTDLFLTVFMDDYKGDRQKACKAFAEDLHGWVLKNGYSMGRNALAKYGQGCVFKIMRSERVFSKEKTYVDIYDFVYDFCDVMLRNTRYIIDNGNPPDVTPSESGGFLSVDVLREICRCVPASSLPGYGKSCELHDLYVPTRLCRPKVVEQSLCQLPDVIREEDTYPLGSVMKLNSPMFLLGKSGSGKTIAMHSIAMRKCARNESDAEVFSRIPALEDKHVFIMQCGDLTDSFSMVPDDVRFKHYIEESIRRISYIRENGRVSGMEASLDEYHRYYQNVIQDAANGKLLLLIDGLDHLNCEASSRGDGNSRKLFLDALKAFVREYPRVQYILTAAPDTYCGDKSLYEYSRDMSAQVYMLAPFSDSDVRTFCEKWSRLTGKSDEFAQASARTIITSELRGLLELPMLLSCFLSTVSADRTNTFMSELLLISATVDIATRNFIAVRHDESIEGTDSVGDRLIYKYDVKMPLAHIALYMTRNNLEKIPLHRSRHGGYICSAEDILYPKGTLNGIAPAMDPYLTDQSYIRRGRMELFFRQLTGGENKYPFINITRQYVNREGVNEECEFFSFSSPIFQNYFCAYAIGKGCRTESVEELIAGSNGLASFCQFSGPRDEALFRRRVRIIADAAIISRIGVSEYVDVLIELASDTSVYHRRYRELAVFALVRILGRSPILPEEKWKEAIDAALEYSLYHEQLDDIRRILKTAPRKQMFFNYIYTSFCSSVVNQYPIPRFNWLMGYITGNWLSLTQSLDSLMASYDQFHVDQIFEEISQRIESGMRVNNDIDVLCQRINEAISRKVDSPLLMILVAAFCSHFWMSAPDTVIAESLLRQRVSSIGDCDICGEPLEYEVISKEQVDLILLLLSYCGSSELDSQRLVNQMCYSIVHCRSIQKNGSSRLAPMEDLSVTLHENYLEKIVNADYHGRLAKKSTGHDCLCGGVRVMTVISINRSDYGRCADDARRRFYHDLWLKNSGVDANGVQQSFAHDEGERGDSARKLMLLFKLCYLAGAFGRSDTDAIIPIKQLLLLKYPGINQHRNFRLDSTEYEELGAACFEESAHIGLKYDLEDEFGLMLRSLYDEYK